MSEITVMDYDPNLTNCGRMAVQTVQLTFAIWKYRATMDIQVGGNCTGLRVIDCAVSMAYDVIEENGGDLVLTDADGKQLLSSDDDLQGDDWLKERLIGAEILAITPKEETK